MFEFLLMKERKQMKKKKFTSANLLCFVAGTIFSVMLIIQSFNIITALTQYNKTESVMKGSISIAARGTSIQGSEVEYTVNNEKYKAKIKYKKSSWKKGKIISIYYNPKNITEVVSIDEKLHYILIEVPIIAVFIFGAFFYKDQK